MAAVGVTWGYGSRPELDAAGPDRLVDSPEELLEYIQDVASRRGIAKVKHQG